MVILFQKIGGCPTCANILIGESNSKNMLVKFNKKLPVKSKKERIQDLIGDIIIDNKRIFEDVAFKIHGNDKYSYTSSDFKDLSKSLNILCNQCNTLFKMTPYRHLYLGKGCKYCNHQTVYTKDFYLARDLTDFSCKLYLLKFTSKDSLETFVKIGLTKQSISKRFKGKEYQNYIIETIDLVSGMFFDLVDKESKIINKYSSFKYIPKQKFKGYSECFSLKLIEKLSSISEMI